MLLSLLWPFGSQLATGEANKLSRRAEFGGPVAQETNLSALLRHYDTARGVFTLPPSARIDPTLRQQQRQPWRVFDLWKYGAFVATKAVEVMTDFLSHQVWGPRKKSWGWEMTLISSFMRNVSNHSQLADIVMLRWLIGLAGYVPLPSDAMVTPVTFRVRKRKLRGLLAKSASTETGNRELSGEWVVGRRLWRKLQADWKSSQMDKRAIGRSSHKREDRVILYLHGGAYYMFSAATHRLLTIQLSKFTDARVFAVDYRLAPETRFPGQLYDAVSTYLRLLDELRIPPENVLLAGDSAGGGLALAMLMYLRDNRYPLPAGAILMSPWVDLTMSCDSWDSNAPYDVIPMPKPGDHLDPVSCYLGEDLEKFVTHPYASPLFGDFHDLPPLLIQAGDSEVLRDEITLLAHKATLAGVQVNHELYEDAVHVFQTFPFLESSSKAFLSCRDFVKNELPSRQSHSPRRLHEITQAGLEQEIDNEKTRSVRGDGRVMENREHGGISEAERVDNSSSRESDVERPSWSRRGDRFMHSSSTLRDDEDSSTGYRGSASRDRSPPGRLALRLSLRIRSTPSSPLIPSTNSLSNGRIIPVEGRLRNHRRCATGGQVRMSTLISSIVSIAPQPIIRSRSRTISHPDIFSLCQQWADSGPANRTTRFSSVSPRSET